MAPLEILHGQPSINLCIMKPELLESALEYTNKSEKPLFAQSYLERFCDDDPEMKRIF